MIGKRKDMDREDCGFDLIWSGLGWVGFGLKSDENVSAGRHALPSYSAPVLSYYGQEALFSI